MIIEIKNLPNGQKIKHVHIDIDFDDNGNVSEERVSVNNSVQKTDDDMKNEQPIGLEQHVHESKEIQREEPREKMDIPPEMLDGEF